MIELLVDELVARFAEVGEEEIAFLHRLKLADQRLTRNYRRALTGSDLYADPLVRSAYLLRYLGHSALQLGDLLKQLEDNDRVADLLSRPELRLVSSCGGPCPEAISLAVVHGQGGGRRLEATVLDRQARHWRDCWPISAAIAQAYGQHPGVAIEGIDIDLQQLPLAAPVLAELGRADVFTLMNGLNEGLAQGDPVQRQRMEGLLGPLPSGTLVLISDMARYSLCRQGMTLLHRLLVDLGATILVAHIRNEHEADNAFWRPRRIAWIYDGDDNFHYRRYTRTLQIAALLP